MAHPEKKRITRIRKKTVFKRLAVIMVRMGIIFFLLLFLAISLLYLPPLQNWITGKVEQLLTEKLSTKVEVGAIHLNFVAQMVVRNLYVEDQQQDTLWSSESIHLRIPVYPLFKKQLLLHNVALRGIKGKYVIYNTQSDSTNLDFILRTFDNNEEKSDGDSGWQVDAAAISLNDVDLLYDDQRNASQLRIRLGSLEIDSEQSDLLDLNFHLSSVHLQNTALSIKSIPGTNILDTNKFETDMPTEGMGLLAKIDQVVLENCTMHYTGPTEAENTSLLLGKVKLEDFVFDGEKYRVQSEAFSITDSRLAVATLSSEQDTTEIIEPLSLDFGWNVELHALKLKNNSFLFHQKSLSDSHIEPDFALEVSKIDLAAANLSVSNDTLRANIEQLAFYENKGMKLQECQADLLLCDKKLDIQDLKMKTPYSEISASFAAQNSPLFSFSQALLD